MRGEGGVVAAAVLGVEHQTEVQQLGLKRRVGRVLAQHHQEVLRRRAARHRVAHEERLPVVIVHLRLIGIGRHRGEARHQVDALAQHRRDAHRIGRLVIAVSRENRPCQGVHDVPARLADNLFQQQIGQRALGVQDRVPLFQLGLVRQLPEEQQIRRLLEAGAPFALEAVHQFLHVHPAIELLARHRDQLILVHHVAVNRADTRQPNQHARAILVAQTALHVVAPVKLRVDLCARTRHPLITRQSLLRQEGVRPRFRGFFLIPCHHAACSPWLDCQ